MSAQELPHEVRVAHGLEEAARRGPKPGLSLEAITAAGIRLADADGLAGVSMAKVAKELGVTTMALYRYVESKDALVRLMADSTVSTLRDYPAGPAWKDGLRQWTLDVIDNAMSHPWVAELPITGGPLLPGSLTFLDRALAILDGQPLDLGEKLSTVMLLSGHARTEAVMWSQIAASRAAAGVSDVQADTDYAEQLAFVVSPERFPTLHREVSAGGFSEGIGDQDDDAEMRSFGLERILDGLEAHIAQRHAGG
ncbi:TetR/AcrR family transcriptional regulator [Zafaria sp. Z1313]|uniref:TetR/AcrR family transcriptional regulator n=1 Tax=unclassified Zafaria TaxID=2828765 RepID=UPI002E78BC8F|nr:TetR/AcrR family transcriptional regulator [Zafaria sp. J156]MEE1621614.1 TetR/AcrR family transcriptional regulator [Zafaria sp. J156]